MNSFLLIGIAILALFAGVSLIALYSRRVGNSNQDAATLVGTATVLVIGLLGIILFIDRLGLSATGRWWALRIGFVALTVVLWRASSRITRKSVR